MSSLYNYAGSNVCMISEKNEIDFEIAVNKALLEFDKRDMVVHDIKYSFSYIFDNHHCYTAMIIYSK